MTLEEAEELLATNARLTAEVVRLRDEILQLTAQLREALARIAELDKRKPDPPSFVKPNRPAKTEPLGPRKKRAAALNSSRNRATPTRNECHALERCPDCQYRLVILRKISGGTRSPADSKTRFTLASLFATWAARGRNPFTACLAALQQSTQAPLAASR